MANLVKSKSTRATALRALPTVVDALSCVNSDDRVAAAACPMLQNLAFLALSEDRDASSPEAKQAALAAGTQCLAACQSILASTGRDGVALAVSAAVGTLARCSSLRASVQGNRDLNDSLAKAGSTHGGKVKECVEDIMTVLEAR